MRPGVGDARGQASLELVGLLPLLVVVALAVAQFLAAAAARELAGNAAEAGALALLQDRDPREAARRALPGWSRERLRVEVTGRRVEVRLRPVAALPGLAGPLTASVSADAGPRPGAYAGSLDPTAA